MHTAPARAVPQVIDNNILQGCLQCKEIASTFHLTLKYNKDACNLKRSLAKMINTYKAISYYLVLLDTQVSLAPTHVSP